MWSIRINENREIEMSKLVSNDFIDIKLTKFLENKKEVKCNRIFKYGITRISVRIQLKDDYIIKEILKL